MIRADDSTRTSTTCFERAGFHPRNAGFSQAAGFPQPPGIIRPPGFPRPNGVFHHNGLLARVQDGWLSVESSAAAPDADAVGGMLGMPGLWRWSALEDGGRRKVFEVPPGVWSDDPVDGDPGAGANPGAESTGQACLEWALATSAGRIPAGWTAPAIEDVEHAIPEGAGTVQVGSVVRNCLVERTADRLALRCPVVPQLPKDLPLARRRWLESIVVQAPSVWRLVRLGVDRSLHAVVAEVDVTGAPPSVIPILIPAALDSLRWVVAWAAQPANLIASDVYSASLTVGPSRALPEKGGRHV